MQRRVVPSSSFANLKHEINVLSSAIDGVFCPICNHFFNIETNPFGMPELEDSCCGYMRGIWDPRMCDHYQKEGNFYFIHIIDDWYWAYVKRSASYPLRTEWLSLTRSSDYISFWGNSTFITTKGDIVVRCNSNSAAPCYLGLRFNPETRTKLRKLYYSSPDADKMLIEFAPGWELKKTPLLESV